MTNQQSSDPGPDGDVMRWVVGLDLRAHSSGAIHFANWLYQQGQPGTQMLTGLHAVDPEVFKLARAPSRSEVLGSARKAAEAAVLSRGARPAFTAIDAVESEDVIESLAEAARLAATTGLIVGRRARSDDFALVRLGKVARRLLRRLEGPMFVVPPELERDGIGSGPILCAVELDAQGAAVARFGERLGRSLKRPVQLVHVFDAGDPIGMEYLPEGSWDDMHRVRHETSEVSLERWRQASGLAAPTMLATGQTVAELVSAAQSFAACMLLCGSRRLSLAQRMWSASVASTLAAAADLPVGVVPVTDEGDD